MSLRIRPLDAPTCPAWDAYVRSASDGTFFHLSAWRDVLRQSFGHSAHYLLAERDGSVVGVLPLARLRSLFFGDALVSTPFCVYGGVVAEDASVRAALEDEACRLATQLGVDYLELRNRAVTRAEWPTKDLYVTFRKGIAPDHEKNLNAIPRKQRAMVRKGISAGLTARVETSVDTLYDIYSKSVRNLGTPVFARRYLQVLAKTFRKDCEITTILNGREPVASLMSFYFRDEVLPYYGGGNALARPVAGNDFLYWDLMQRAANRGARMFDYGRSKRGTGSFSFKEHWGFEAQPLTYQYFLVRAPAMPNLSPTNPKYGHAIALWRKLPLRLTQLIGPPVAKYLG